MRTPEEYETLRKELEEYEYRKKNNFPLRKLYFGLIFQNIHEVREAEKILRERSEGGN